MFTSDVAGSLIIVRVSLLSKKKRALPRGMSYNFIDAAMGELGMRFPG